ncbi:MAG: multicopper oxidase domain-containing protein, partial [Gammaproteobacteria bacterium]|nr:multicopper oxidase domain-containing protein [Gammaproteobacteria bacterium]NIW40524.1 multicopper oxidase domain-containing protein [candidate division Zixibacteria bacterium]
FPHTFHVHDVQFSILSIDGKTPPPLLSGPKDTILVWPGEEYRIALRFEDYTGIYMYHCHLLEHEDSGMMGQFLIE